jgi:hypothetical protein
MITRDWIVGGLAVLIFWIVYRYVAPLAGRWLASLHHPCADGHAWVHMGGRNAGCSAGCYCSVPVYSCERCGDCDYGDNAEAAEQMAKCQSDAEQLDKDPV